MNVKLSDAQLKYKNQLQIEYGRYYPLIDWVDKTTADRLNKKKKALLNKLVPFVESGCNKTKPDVSSLAPGCRLCAAGQWSCLFINGMCNANCFYCPAPQMDEGLPQSNGLHFETPGAYVAYVKNFGFKAVSISGGEPLMSFERSLAYLRAVKQEFGNKIHVWMYTNGILATMKKLKILRDAGLDEIRYDIGATNYNLKYLKLAIGIIPVVTVEIPAVPDEIERLKTLVGELATLGVNYLNLHQMRMTKHNMPEFVERGLLISHGKRATVPESEITALKIMLHVKQCGIDLPVNYCSYAYKDRYQHATSRYRQAKYIKEDYEDVTSNAYIRSMALQGDKQALTRCIQLLREIRPGWEWYHDQESGSLFLNMAALKSVNECKNLNLIVEYHNTRIRKSHDPAYTARTVFLDKETQLYIERRPEGAGIFIEYNDIPEFLMLISEGVQKIVLPVEKIKTCYPVIYHEFIESGLPDYY
jgi:pyruvate formate-lyase activating enzyme-like uncharacterized protein